MMNELPATASRLPRGITRRYQYDVISDGYALRVEEILPPRGPVTALTLLVHGQTFPAGVGFDLGVPGYSLVEYLACRGVACCLFDQRGYGRSAKPSWRAPIGENERARDLAAVFARLTRRHPGVPITLVGLSSGCNVIARFLARTDARPAAVVCVSPCYLANPALRTAFRRVRFVRFLRSLVGRRSDPYARLPRRLLARKLRGSSAAPHDPAVLDRFLDDAIAQQSPGSRCLRSPVLALVTSSDSPRPWEALFDAGAIRCPLLVIHGAQDELCCARSAHALACDAGAPLTEVVTLEDCGHDPHLHRRRIDYFAALHRFVAPSLAAVG